MQRHFAIVGLGLALGLAAAPAADQFTPIDYPGATATSASGINDQGDIVGNYTLAGQTHGFLLAGGKFTDIDFPGAKSTSASAINSNGDIVGGYTDQNGNSRGFLFSKGVFTPLDYPGAVMTGPIGINSNGDIVGHLTAAAGKPMQGFLLRAGAWTVVDYRPEAPSNTMNCYFGINDAGAMVGHWGTRGSRHGVMYQKGTFTQIDHGDGGNTDARGINNAGDIVGIFRDAGARWHGFLLRNGRYSQFDYPGANNTFPTGLNSNGAVTGYYVESGRTHGFVARLAPSAPPAPVLTVDDDGADCPGSVRTIQEAVAQAAPGSTILVCPGTYLHTVNLVGPEKNGLKLIAEGREGEVVLQGDYTERDGFHLENVSNVLIRGFTVRDFGNQATTATQWGAGNQIYLENAHYNTLAHNRLINGDMRGIMLVNSGSNVIEHNVAWVDNSNLATCGLHLEGAKSARNTIRLNMTFGNKMAGIMVRGAGPGNRVLDNTVLANGRFGIDVQNTDEIWIEGNRVSYSRGFFGSATPGGTQPGLGLNLVNVNQATVFDNRARSNTGADLNWDGKGENKLESNACETSTPAGACVR